MTTVTPGPASSGSLLEDALAALARLDAGDPALVVLRHEVPGGATGATGAAWWRQRLAAWLSSDPGAAAEVLRDFIAAAQARSRRGYAEPATGPAQVPAPVQVPQPDLPRSLPATRPRTDVRQTASAFGGGNAWTVHDSIVNNIEQAVVNYSGKQWSGSLEPPWNQLPTVHGRDGLLGLLRAALFNPDRRPHVLHGLAGSGKTTIALKLAAEARATGRFKIYWVDAQWTAQAMAKIGQERGAGKQDFLSAALGIASTPDVVWHRLNQPAPGEEDQSWLLIFDNADDPDLLDAPELGTGWFRSGGRGLVLVTTRYSDPSAWGPDAVRHQVDPVDRASGAQILCDLAPDAGPADEAAMLSDWMGHLPLGLHLAGRYLNDGRRRYRTFAQYLAALNAGHLELIDHAAEPGYSAGERSARRRVLATWNLSIEMLEQHGFREARRVLEVLSCYGAPHPIPVDMLVGVTDEDGQALAELRLDQVIDQLESVSLVRREPRGGRPDVVPPVSLHPLLSQVIAAQVPPAEREAVWNEAADQLYLCTPDAEDPENWPLWHLLWPIYAAVLRALPEQLRDDLAGAVRRCGEAAVYLTDVGDTRAALALAAATAKRAADLKLDRDSQMLARFVDARVRMEAAPGEESFGVVNALLADLIAAYGEDDHRSLLLRLLLGLALIESGLVTEGTEHLKAGLEIGNRIEGADSLLSFGIRMALAAARAEVGEVRAAVEELRRLTAIAKARFAPEDGAEREARYAIALILLDDGNAVAAVPELDAVLAEQQRLLGREHPETLTTESIWNVARMQAKQPPSPERAREIAERLERVYGSGHRSTLGARLGVVLLLADQGDAEGAGTELARLRGGLADRAAGDPLRLQVEAYAAVFPGLANPAELASARGRLAAIRQEANWAPEHPLTHLLSGLESLTQEELGDLEGARLSLRLRLEEERRSLGPLRPETLDTWSRLVNVLYAAKDPAAEDEIARFLAAFAQQRGEDHPNYMTKRYLLAALLGDRGDHAGAAAHCRIVRAWEEQAYGACHECTLETSASLSGHLYQTGDLADCAAELEKVVDCRARGSAPADEDSLRARVNLVAVRRRLEAIEPAQAVVTYRALVAETTAVLGAGHGLTLTAHGNFGNALSDAGRWAQAEAEYQIVREALLKGEERETWRDLVRNSELMAGNRELAEDPSGAAAAMSEVIAWAVRWAGEHSQEAIDARRTRVIYLLTAGQAHAAIAEQRQVRDALIATAGAGHPDTLFARWVLAATMLAAGQPALAVAELRETTAGAESSEEIEFGLRLRYLHDLAHALDRSGESLQAQRVCESSLSLCATGDMGAEYAWFLRLLLAGILLIDRDQVSEADRQLGPLREQLAGDGQDADLVRRVRMAITGLEAAARLATGDAEAAIAALTELLADATGSERLSVLGQLAAARLLAGQLELAEAELRSVAGSAEATPDRRDEADLELASLLSVRLRYADAASQITAVLARQEGRAGPHQTRARVDRGEIMFASGDLAAASEDFAEVLAATAPLGPNHQHVLRARLGQGWVALGRGDPTSAQARARDVLACYESTGRSESAEALRSRELLGRALLERGDARAALPVLSAAVARYARMLGVDHQVTLTARIEEAAARREAGDPRTALDALDAILRVLPRVPPGWADNEAAARFQRALTRHALGEPDALAELADAVRALRERLGAGHHEVQRAERASRAATQAGAGSRR